MAHADPQGPYTAKQATGDLAITTVGVGGYVKSFSLSVTTNAGKVTLKNGTTSGDILLQLDLDAATAQNSITWNCGPVRFETDIFCDLTGAGATACVVYNEDTA